MERKIVYAILDKECVYQDNKWTDANIEHGIPDDEKPVAEWINFMEYHLNKAKEAIYHLKTNAALSEVRKITALGVRAMEFNGCPEREGYEVSVNKNEYEKELDQLTEDESIEEYVNAVARKFEQMQERQDISEYIDRVSEKLKSLRPYAEPDPDHVCGCAMDNGTCGCGHDD